MRFAVHFFYEVDGSFEFTSGIITIPLQVLIDYCDDCKPYSPHDYFEIAQQILSCNSYVEVVGIFYDGRYYNSTDLSR